MDYTIPIKNRDHDIVGYVLVDMEDYEKLSKMSWNLSKGYANTRGNVTMHRMLMGNVPKDHVVDHINNNKLDNRKSNLRIASRAQNSQNKQKKKGALSKYIGVSQGHGGKWTTTCGKFQFPQSINEINAAKTYDICAYLLYGKHAKTNELITYEEALQFNIPDMLTTRKKQSNLPPGIFCDEQNNKTYYICYSYNKKRVKKRGFETIEDAVKYLDTLKRQNEEADNHQHYMQPIQRNVEGIAILKVKGHEILVDDDKWHDLMKYSWCLKDDKYLTATINKKHVHLHHHLCFKEPGKVVDHINRNSFDNRINNLRCVSSAVNNQNKVPKKDSASQYKGVRHVNQLHSRKIWCATIRFEGLTYNLGCHEREIDAAKAYNAKAIELYGEHAYLNIFDEEK